MSPYVPGGLMTDPSLIDARPDTLPVEIRRDDRWARYEAVAAIAGVLIAVVAVTIGTIFSLAQLRAAQRQLDFAREAVQEALSLEKQVSSRNLLMEYLIFNAEQNEKTEDDFICPGQALGEEMYDANFEQGSLTVKYKRYIASTALFMRMSDSYSINVGVDRQFCIWVTGRIECHITYLASAAYASFGKRTLDSQALLAILDRKGAGKSVPCALLPDDPIPDEDAARLLASGNADSDPGQ
jgi:hypothetical protein